jgi:5-methylcytosine-specific restriction protein A
VLVATRQGRTPWEGSTRKQRLPPNWDTELKPAAQQRNPQRICHWCGNPDANDLDHLQRGDDHRIENLDWIHGRNDVLAGRSDRNCHGEKSGAEGAAAAAAKLRAQRRPPEPHPAFV